MYESLKKLENFYHSKFLAILFSAQNNSWKLVSHYSKEEISLASPLEMYSKFVLPNWTCSVIY